jgi:hypothetical protein
MAFQVVSSGSPSQVTVWCPIATGKTVYHGQIVEIDGDDGIQEIDVASSTNDTSGNTIIYGIVVGDNNVTPVYDSTYKVNKITDVASQANQIARKWSGAEGHMYPKGDSQALAEVVLLDVNTYIKGPVRNADIDVNMTLLTATTGSTDGLSGIVTNSCEHTPVSQLSIMHCRTGANKGLYRVTQDASKVSPTNTTAWPYDVATGDTFVRAPFRQGRSYIYIDSLAMYVDSSLGVASHYYAVDVLDMDLSVAGSETVTFKFAPTHFDGVASD